MNTIDQLKRSTDMIIKTRPFYSEILGFYSRVFEAQEESRNAICLDPVVIGEDLLQLKKKNRMPLVDLSQLKVDGTSAANLLKRICELAQDTAPQLAGEGEAVLLAVQKGDLDPEELFRAILENRESDMKEHARRIKVDVEKLELLGYLAMAPSISACAQQLETYLEKEEQHNEGFCPVCGSQPDLAILDEKGRRFLKCSFCSHQWASKRLGCVFCGNSDPDKQQYFYSDEEKEYRVNLCDACGNYIKGIDLRQMNRFFHPGLEQISTLHLDMKAREKGYTSNVRA